MIVFSLFAILSLASSQSTLQFVQIWFRHGERLPTHYLVLPGDPPGKQYLQLAEPGEMTNRGIEQEYKLGNLLKERYGKFLGDYKPSNIHTYTGVDNRTVASAQAVMAALFPPTGTHIWNKNLLWQPISMHTMEQIDWVSTGINDYCPVYKKNYDTPVISKTIAAKIQQDVIHLMGNATNRNLENDATTVNHLIDSLNVRKALNDSRLPYPTWAEPIKDKITGEHYKFHEAILDMQNQSIGGYHIEKVLAFMEDHLKRPQTNINKAVFLAGHDTNIFMITKVLNLIGLPTLELPGFGSHLAIELHLIDGVHIVKFFYQNGIDFPLVEVSLTHCSSPCSLQRLQTLGKDHRTSDEELMKICRGIGPISSNSGLFTRILIGLTAILLLTTVIFGCSSFNYKKQLMELNDPERRHLLH